MGLNTNYKLYWRKVTIFIGTIIVMPMLVSLISPVTLISFAYADVGSNNKGIFPPDSTSYGLTYGEWTAKWWQWAFSMPKSDSALVDDTGKNCANNQSGPVWFLAGTGGGSVSRECTVPADKGILVPIINVECDNASGASPRTEQELRACAKADQDKVFGKEIIVDGIKIEDLDKYRLQSPIFDLNLPENNTMGVKPQTTKAVSDGFWVLLEPLSPGKHDIHFKGVLGSPTATGTTNFALDVRYVLTVSEGAASAEEEKSNNQPIMLQGSSTSGKFKVELDWTPNDIGKGNTFAIKIMDTTGGKQLNNATYDMMFFQGDKHLDETHRAGQTAAQQTYSFSGQGDYVLRIDNINGAGEDDMINIPINVVPEFPLNTSLAIVTLVFAAIIFVTKSKIASLRSNYL